jgi:serine O-acetyltransferase
VTAPSSEGVVAVTDEVVDQSSQPTTFRALLRLVREDHAVNSEGLWTPGFYALAVHRLGAWAAVARVPEALRRVLLRLHHVAFMCVRIAVGIEIPRTARIGRRVRFAHQNGVVIHELATIGDDTVVRHGVTLGARSNDPARYREQAPTIGRRVTLGVGCVIAGRVHVGDDARIGPNTVVLQDVPARATVVPPEPVVVTWASRVRE